MNRYEPRIPQRLQPWEYVNVFMVTGVGIVTETIENKKWQTIGIALSIILGTLGVLVPTTDQYLATCLYNENPPKTAEQTLEIIKKARMDYHHLRAEQYKKD